MYTPPTVTEVGSLATLTRSFNKVGSSADAITASAAALGLDVVGSFVRR